MFISAHQDDSNGNSSGSVYYYNKIDSNWTFIEKIIPDDGQPNDFFGIPYLKENYLYVGAPGWSRPAVYIFKYIEGNWEQKQKLQPDTDSLIFGYGLSFGGNITQHNSELFIGARYDSRYAQSSGAVYIYETSMKNLFTHKEMIIMRVPSDQKEKL